MKTATVLRAKHLVLSVAIGLALFYLVMVAASSAYAQADEYFLMPADVYYYEPVATTGSTFDVAGNDLLMTGSCTSGGGWTSCGAGIAVTRPTSDEVDAVLGFIIDWQNAYVSSQTYPRPEAVGSNVSGAGTFLSGAQGCAVSGGPDCTTPYEKRWCITTDARATELDHLDCDETPNHWRGVAEPITSTHDSLILRVTNTAGGTRSILIYVSMYWLVLDCPTGQSPDVDNICQEDTPPPPPPSTPEGPVDPGATCSFNYSTTITSTGGTTVTEEYSYTVAANLVQNYSFEDNDGTSPEHWTVSDYQPPIGIFALLFYGSGIFDARTGVRYVRPGGDSSVVLIQDMEIYAPGVYQYGFYYRCSELAGTCSFYNAANMGWDYNEFLYAHLSSTHSPTYYVTVSDTVVSNGNSPFITLQLNGPIANWEDDEIFVDDLYIWPVDEDGEILCSPEYYPVPPGQPITTTNPSPSNCTATFGGLCFPPVLDASCWSCQRPSSLLAIGEWIAWLFCHIRNLFFCHLYHWLLAIMNWVAGVWTNLLSFLNWLPTVGQSILNWTVGAYNNVVAWFAGLWERIVSGATNWLRTLVQNLLNSNLVQAIYNFVGGLNYIWDLFAAMAQLFVDFMRGLFNAILDVINLFISLVMAIREAIATPAYEWDFSTVDPATLTRDAAYAEQASRGVDSGTWSDTEIMYIFLIALATGDQVLSSFGMGYIQFLIIGGLSVTLIFWTLRKWEYILPI